MAEARQKAVRLRDPRCPQGPGVVARWELLPRPARRGNAGDIGQASRKEEFMSGRWGRTVLGPEDGKEGEGGSGAAQAPGGTGRVTG